MQRFAALVFCALAFPTLILGCKTKEKFPSLGLGVASPIDVAVSEDGNTFYVLNSDFDRTYDVGSVLVLDKDGNKLNAVEVPRMGRSLTVAGNDLIVTVDYATEDDSAHVLILDISDAQNPVLKADLPIECSPFNAVAEKGYSYFFIACISGTLYQGQFGEPRENSVLKEVRNYGTTRRAIYLDTKRGLLLGFTTDASKQTTVDRELRDEQTWDSLVKEVLDENGQPIPDEVPDEYQSNRRVAGNKASRQLYQFFVYDIEKEKANAPGCTVTEDENCSFPFRSNSDPIVDSELRWIYFRLTNFDGTPDPSPELNTKGYRYYRTNFYEAKKDPFDDDVFYLSHRGNPSKSKFANQIVRVTITGDLHVDPETLKPPHTEDVMSFDRVYGFKGTQATKYVYPGDFEVAQIQGQKTVVVNNFRDLINWVRSDTYFSIGAQVVDDFSWIAETYERDTSYNRDPSESFFQVAVNSEGRALSCSFYGNAVLLLDIKPGIGISDPKRIE
jgi:hypothetical protein